MASCSCPISVWVKHMQPCQQSMWHCLSQEVMHPMLGRIGSKAWRWFEHESYSYNWDPADREIDEEAPALDWSIGWVINKLEAEKKWAGQWLGCNSVGNHEWFVQKQHRHFVRGNGREGLAYAWTWRTGIKNDNQMCHVFARYITLEPMNSHAIGKSLHSGWLALTDRQW